MFLDEPVDLAERPDIRLNRQFCCRAFSSERCFGYTQPDLEHTCTFSWYSTRSVLDWFGKAPFICYKNTDNLSWVRAFAGSAVPDVLVTEKAELV